MINLKKVLISIGISSYILLTTSCNTSRLKNSDNIFKKNVFLKGNIEQIDIPLNVPLIYVYDTLTFFTMTDRQNDKDIYVFTNDYKYVSSSGKKGKGPGELVNPFFPVLDKDNQVFYILDQGRNKIFVYPLDSIIRNKNFLPDSIIPCPTKYPVIVQYRPYGKDLFSFLNQFDNHVLISFFNKNGHVIEAMNIPDKIDLYKNFNYRGYSSLSIYRFNPDQDKIAISYRLEDAIFVLDSHGNILNKHYDANQKIQDPNKQNNRNTYFSLDVDRKYIYGLYSGKNIFEINNNGQVSVNYPRTLLVYNWELKPIVKITFELPVASFAIDYVQKRFVTWCPDNGTIVWYKIPDFL